VPEVSPVRTRESSEPEIPGIVPAVFTIVAAFHQEVVSVPEMGLALIRRAYCEARPAMPSSPGAVQRTVADAADACLLVDTNEMNETTDTNETRIALLAAQTDNRRRR